MYKHNLTPQLHNLRQSHHLQMRSKNVLHRISKTRSSYIHTFSKDILEKDIKELKERTEDEIILEFQKFVNMIKECSHTIQLDAQCFEILINAIQLTHEGWQFLLLLCQRIDSYQLCLLGNQNLLDQIQKQCMSKQTNIQNLSFIVKILGWLCKPVFKNFHKRFYESIIEICQTYSQDLLNPLCFMFYKMIQSYNNQQAIHEFLENNIQTFVKLLPNKNINIYDLCEGFTYAMKLNDIYFNHYLIQSQFFNNLVSVIQRSTNITNLSSAFHCFNSFLNLAQTVSYKYVIPAIIDDIPKIVQIVIMHLQNYQLSDNFKLKLLCFLRIVLCIDELSHLIELENIASILQCFQQEIEHIFDKNSDEYSQTKFYITTQNKGTRENTIETYLKFLRKYLSTINNKQFYKHSCFIKFGINIQKLIQRQNNISTYILHPCLEVLNVLASNNVLFKQIALNVCDFIQKVSGEKNQQYLMFKLSKIHKNLISL